MPLKWANIFPFPPSPLQTNCSTTQNHNNIQFPISTDTVAVLTNVEQNLQATNTNNNFTVDPLECQLVGFTPIANVNTNQFVNIKNNQKTAFNKLNVPAMFKAESHIKNPNALVIHFIFIILCLQMIPYILIYCIDECSPLVLFSWWRNKIS